MTDDFIQKLMIAKQVMDKTNNIPRGGVSESVNFGSRNILRTTNPCKIQYSTRIYADNRIKTNY
jgi:hypothetical protein